MSFWNCSKTLLDDVSDYSNTWKGYNAKYFETCDQSNSAQIIIFEKTIREAEETVWSGTTYAKSETYCKNLFGGNSAVNS